MTTVDRPLASVQKDLSVAQTSAAQTRAIAFPTPKPSAGASKEAVNQTQARRHFGGAANVVEFITPSLGVDETKAQLDTLRSEFESLQAALPEMSTEARTQARARMQNLSDQYSKLLLQLPAEARQGKYARLGVGDFMQRIQRLSPELAAAMSQPDKMDFSQIDRQAGGNATLLALLTPTAAEANNRPAQAARMQALQRIAEHAIKPAIASGQSSVTLSAADQQVLQSCGLRLEGTRLVSLENPDFAFEASDIAGLASSLADAHRAAPLRLGGNAFDAAALEHLADRAESAIAALDQAVDAQATDTKDLDLLRIKAEGLQTDADTTRIAIEETEGEIDTTRQELAVISSADAVDSYEELPSPAVTSVFNQMLEADGITRRPSRTGGSEFVHNGRVLNWRETRRMLRERRQERLHHLMERLGELGKRFADLRQRIGDCHGKMTTLTERIAQRVPVIAQLRRDADQAVGDMNDAHAQAPADVQARFAERISQLNARHAESSARSHQVDAEARQAMISALQTIENGQRTLQAGEAALNKARTAAAQLQRELAAASQAAIAAADLEAASSILAPQVGDSAEVSAWAREMREMVEAANSAYQALRTEQVNQDQLARSWSQPWLEKFQRAQAYHQAALGQLDTRRREAMDALLASLQTQATP
ncbi:MAG: hypothetical protein ACO1RX_19215 [Candidatus Sericytochromatia bacterium]